MGFLKSLICLTLALSFTTPSFAADDSFFAPDADLELVRSYLSAHQQPLSKAGYVTLISLPFINEFVLLSANTARMKMVKYGALAALAAPFAYYLYKILNPNQKETMYLDRELGVPSGLDLQVTKTQFTPEEVDRVRSYIRDNRKWVMWNSSPYWAGWALISNGHILKKLGRRADKGMLRSALTVSGRVSSLLALYAFVDATIYAVGGSRFSLLGRWLESSAGLPGRKAAESSDKPSAALDAIARMPAQDAQKLMAENPEARELVQLAAQVIRATK